MSVYPHVLVATLGGQPQVVTFTLDLLLAAGYPIREVIVVHPRAAAPSRMQSALVHLSAEFAGKKYVRAQWAIHFHSCVLELNGKPIDDIVDDIHADGTLTTIHQLINGLKRQGHHIHLSTTGGRRLIAQLATSVAALNFDRHDNIWHIYTPDALQEQAKEGQIMHVSPDAGVKLINSPFIALGAYMPNALGQSFRSARDEKGAQIEAQEHARRAQVVEKASPAQLRVLQAFAGGLRLQQVAEELSLSPATINSHKTALLDLCRNSWDIAQTERLDYHFLARNFADYFQDNR